MKKYFVVLIGLMVSLSVYADNKDSNKIKEIKKSVLTNLSGVVVDSESGELLVGVEVILDDGDLKTYTDLDGRFSFEDIKQGEYNLSAHYISYNKKSVKFELGPSENDFKVKLETTK